MSEKFEFLGKVGEGAFATVYKVKRLEDSNIYAFKKMKAVKMTDRELSNSLN
jgi:NIMA (never in mitosis gene a)-related kinase